MGKNTKKRVDDRRGYKEWTLESKDKVRKASTRHYQLNDKEWLQKQYLELKKTTVAISKEVGCAPSTVYFALIRLEIPKRTRKEARKGIKFSKEHLDNVTKANRKRVRSGSDHWNWQGGITSEGDSKRAAVKNDPRYKAWKKAVRSIGYCEACGSCKRLEAHHVLPKAKFPHLIHDINNGKCLCHACHKNLHSFKEGSELLENLEQTISSQAEVGILQKVQRLEAETRTVGNASTSAVPLRDDIVRTSQGCEEV